MNWMKIGKALWWVVKNAPMIVSVVKEIRKGKEEDQPSPK